MLESELIERGQLCLNHPLKEYTSWKIGGCADRVFFPKSREDLSSFLASLPSKEPVYWLGLGSNTLIRDGGIRGTVIITQKGLRNIEKINDTRVYAEAGVSCATLARNTAREGLLGLEFLAGIPGTLGGAIAMNAGCHGGETWDRLIEVETIDHQGRIRKRTRDEFEVAYREVKRPPSEWFLSGTFELIPGAPEVAKENIKELLAYRATTQPINVATGGSVFRNPTGDYAGRLIEICELKGLRIGNSMVSTKHANFIVNIDESSTAEDLETLIEFIIDHVHYNCGVRLIPEIHCLGEPLKKLQADEAQSCASALEWVE